MQYQLRVDGRAVAVEAEPSATLLLVLRNDLGLSGPKFGCGLGQCGSCTVLVDGEPVRSCLRRMSSLEPGAAIVTIAGLGTPDRPHPVQAAFVAEQAAQCGYCTAGMVVAAAALVDRARAEGSAPTDDEIREALAGNLCRCGSHDRILRAVKRAAAGGEGSPEARGTIGGVAALAALAGTRGSAPGAIEAALTAGGDGAGALLRPLEPDEPPLGLDPAGTGPREAASARLSGPTRRTLLGGGGFLLLGFSLGGRRALAQPPAPAPRLPGSLAGARALDAWIRVGADGTVTVLSGKVELGQGIRTALAQIVADELDVEIGRLRMVPADTDLSPNEGYTSGSVSIQQSGAALRQAGAEVRSVLLELAAARLGVAVDALRVEDGRVSAADAGDAPARSGEAAGSVTYWELVTGEALHRDASGRATPKPVSERRLVGRPVERLDIPGKVFGDPVFVHDHRLPGMLHARVVRPPSYGARLASLDETAARAVPGLVAVVRDGSFLAVVAEREEQATAAAAALASGARWSGDTSLPDVTALPAWLRAAPSQTGTVSSRGPDPAGVAAAVTLEAEYAKPFIAHASLAPSCAVAAQIGDRLLVWTHSQGVFPLRAALAKVLGLPQQRIRVIHMDGAGCYGHNGADDVACDAALIARALPGRPVRVQWTREDELRWAPFGSAMAIRVRGGLDEGGAIATWSYELWSHAHSTRPGREAGFAAAWHLERPQPPPTAFNIPQPAGGEDRNAVPLYQFPSQRVIEHLVPEMPIRVSALRSLGGFANVFAIESFLDELAAAAGADPVAFRLRHLEDPRGRAVIEAAARAAGWRVDGEDGARGGAGAAASREPDPGRPARGRGFAFAKYKNQAAYVALVVDVAVDRATGAIRVERATAAVDAGDVVNPDGLRNQIEGGIVQATSWTVFEEVAFDRERITSDDWRSYPIARFPDAPVVSVEVLSSPDDPPVGAGEAAQGPTAAAIANAVAAATGVRLRSLPLRAERIGAAFA